MCGIHLIVSSTNSEKSVLEKLEQSWHRGPDGSNIVSGKLNEDFYTLGHNRLQINGNETHAQPISTERYDFAITGEIYNYRELQSKYNVNPLFNDSYVLLELINRYGLDVLKEVNGMYSFVLIDKEKHQVHLVRDPSGQKPLFYSTLNGLAASSISNSLPNDGLSKEQIRNYLSYKYTALGYSIFEGVNEVVPGTILTLHAELKLTSRAINAAVNLVQKPLKENIEKAVCRHAYGAERVAVLLSGGLDSSIIAQELVSLGKEVVAYTINTKNEENDDLSYARKLCEKLGVAHRVITPDEKDFLDFINTIDLPVGDGAFYFNWLLCRTIKRDGFKFALTGNGADELFGGYNRHLAFYSFKKYKSALFVAKKLYRFLPQFLFVGNNKLNTDKFFTNLSRDCKHTFLNFCRLGFLEPAEEKSSEAFSYAHALAYDRTNYLVKDIFSLSDQAGMSHSVEVRSPFLDASLVANSIKKTKHSYLDVEKNRLKHLYGVGVLKEITERKKVGFGIPFIQFFGTEKLEEMVADIQVLSPYLTEQEIQRMTQLLDKKTDNLSNEYWALLILLSWMKVNK